MSIEHLSIEQLLAKWDEPERPEGWNAGNEHHLAALIIEAFRRSKAHTPSAVKLDWPDHWTQNEKLSDLHARWHEQPGNLLGREACPWERCEFWDAAEFTLRLAEVRVIGREPQGEPSHAHDRDRMGICRKCEMGLPAAEVLDGEKPCPGVRPGGVR
jgi:hypothetical protein